jgi:excinuclease ABC subunit C
MIPLPQLPNNPGCYLFKDSKGVILYIGKAKDLKKRVSSYVQKTDHDAKTQALIKHIKSVDYIVTTTEVEALLLENNLIKKHKPKYNIDLKDSKRYAYLLLTKEQFPRLRIARNKDELGEYFGPFTSAETRDYIRDSLVKTFQLRTCNQLPKKACLRYHIGICTAPCICAVNEKGYAEQVKHVRAVLKNKSTELIKTLEAKMKTSAKKEHFESALTYRNQIQALQFLKEKQHVERDKEYNEDIINFLIDKENVYLTLFSY